MATSTHDAAMELIAPVVLPVGSGRSFIIIVNEDRVRDSPGGWRPVEAIASFAISAAACSGVISKTA